MKMTILERDDGITHIELTGRLDTTGTDEVEELFTAATSVRKRPVVVDLSEIDFLASRGIGLLFANGKRLLKSGHKMVLLNPKKLVASVLATSKVDRILPIASNMSEAIHLLTGLPPSTAPSEPAAESPESEIESPAEQPTRELREGSLEVTVKNDLAELVGLNAKLAEFLAEHGVPRRATYAVNLAIDELVVNVMRYAYIDDDTHLIDIRLLIEGNQVVLRIEDDGRPFDPRTGPKLDLHAEDRDAGGLGLILVLDMVDVLNYQRIEDKNCVEVRIHLATEE